MRRAYSYGVGLADRLGGEARLTSEMASPSIRAAWFAFCPAGGTVVRTWPAWGPVVEPLSFGVYALSKSLLSGAEI